MLPLPKSDADYRWLTPDSVRFLTRGNGYLRPKQTVHERAVQVGKRAEVLLGIPGFCDRFLSQFAQGWFSLSTPVWANFGTDRGLPISCFGQHIPDSVRGIFESVTEAAVMTKNGGGTSGYFGDLRPRGSLIGEDNGETEGVVNFAQQFDCMQQVVGQGGTRRGSFAAYLPVDHPDFREFLHIRSEGHKLQHIHPGACIPAGWMQSMIDGDADKREIWAEILVRRAETGHPYIVFEDNVEAGLPDCYRDLKHQINGSNLCTEILLPRSDEESFVCDLGSMNTRYADEWLGTNAVETQVLLLEAVMTDFINRASQTPHLEKSVRFAERHRAVGIGWLGWHSFLRSKGLGFGSEEAKRWNLEIAEEIQTRAYEASAKLAHRFGEPEACKGFGRRHTTLTAIAPTKSSAFILGQVSEGIEPIHDNDGVHDKQKGRFAWRCPELTALLESRGENTAVNWAEINRAGGSVASLSCLDESEKEAFKVFREIDMKDVIDLAADRQPFIDQGQSLNLWVRPNTPAHERNSDLIRAWKKGVKTIYYQINENSAQNLAGCVGGACEA